MEERELGGLDGELLAQLVQDQEAGERVEPERVDQLRGRPAVESGIRFSSQRLHPAPEAAYVSLNGGGEVPPPVVDIDDALSIRDRLQLQAEPTRRTAHGGV